MLVVLSAINGTAMALVLPAMQSITPRLVTRDLLQRAIALQSFSRGALRRHRPDHQRSARGRRRRRVGARLRRGDVVRGRGDPGASPAPTSRTARGGQHDGRRAARRLGLRTPERRGCGSSSSGFTFLNVIYAGAWLTLGPARANETFGPQGLGAGPLGRVGRTDRGRRGALRRPLQRPLFTGMVWTATLAVPIGRPRRLPPRLADAAGHLRRRHRVRRVRDGVEPRDAGARAGGDAVAGVLLRRARLLSRDPARPGRVRTARAWRSAIATSWW